MINKFAKRSTVQTYQSRNDLSNSINIDFLNENVIKISIIPIYNFKLTITVDYDYGK